MMTKKATKFTLATLMLCAIVLSGHSFLLMNYTPMPVKGASIELVLAMVALIAFAKLKTKGQFDGN